MKTIYIDTNFLLIPAQFNVDIFSEIKRIMHEPYELVILTTMIKELEEIIERQTGKDKAAAKFALQMAKTLKIVEGDGYVDSDLLARATPADLVATQDKELKKRLKAKGVHAIVLKKKRILSLE